MILASQFENHTIFKEATKGFALDFETWLAEHLGLLGVFYELPCGDKGGFWIGHPRGVVPRRGDEKNLYAFFLYQPFAAMRRQRENRFALGSRTLSRYAA
jgi:hypothetical protein